jgi:hypothetical protein
LLRALVLKLSVLTSKALARLVEATAGSVGIELSDTSGGEALEAAGGESLLADMVGDEWLEMVLVGYWTSTKLARTLERGRWAGSERLRREFGERPRELESSRSLAAALFSNSDRRFRTAEEDRGSAVMALEEKRV